MPYNHLHSIALVLVAIVSWLASLLLLFLSPIHDTHSRVLYKTWVECSHSFLVVPQCISVKSTVLYMLFCLQGHYQPTWNLCVNQQSASSLDEFSPMPARHSTWWAEHRLNSSPVFSLGLCCCTGLWQLWTSTWLSPHAPFDHCAPATLG